VSRSGPSSKVSVTLRNIPAGRRIDMAGSTHRGWSQSNELKPIPFTRKACIARMVEIVSVFLSAAQTSLKIAVLNHSAAL
jgi:hypothetical protein